MRQSSEFQVPSSQFRGTGVPPVVCEIANRPSQIANEIGSIDREVARHFDFVLEHVIHDLTDALQEAIAYQLRAYGACGDELRAAMLDLEQQLRVSDSRLRSLREQMIRIHSHHGVTHHDPVR